LGSHRVTLRGDGETNSVVTQWARGRGSARVAIRVFGRREASRRTPSYRGDAAKQKSRVSSVQRAAVSRYDGRRTHPTSVEPKRDLVPLPVRWTPDTFSVCVASRCDPVRCSSVFQEKRSPSASNGQAPHAGTLFVAPRVTAETRGRADLHPPRSLIRLLIDIPVWLLPSTLSV